MSNLIEKFGLDSGQPWINHGGFWPPYESTFSLFPTYKNTSIGIFSSINGPGTTGTVPGTLSQQYLHILIMRVLQGKNFIRMCEVNMKVTITNN